MSITQDAILAKRVRATKGDFCPCCGRPISHPQLSQLLKATREYFGVTEQQLLAHRRRDHTAEIARWAYLACAYQYTTANRRLIAASVGREQTLITHALNRMADNEQVVRALAIEAGLI